MSPNIDKGVSRVLLKRCLALVGRFSVTAGILYYIFTIIPVSDVVQALSAAIPGYIIVALLIQIVMRYAAALRMKLITDTQELPLSTRQILETLFVTSFYGLFLPGTLSAGAVTLYRYYQFGAKPAKALVSIIFSRWIETLMVLVVGVSFWILDLHSWSDYRIGLYLLFLLYGASICYRLFFTRNISSGLLEFITKAVTCIGAEILKKQTTKLIESVKSFHGLPRRTLILILLVSLLHVFLGTLSIYLCAISLSLGLSFITVIWIRSLVYIVTLVPISLMGLGVRESTLVLLLQPYGISSAEAVAWSFLFLAGTLFVACIGAIIEASSYCCQPHPLNEKFKDIH